MSKLLAIFLVAFSAVLLACNDAKKDHEDNLSNTQESGDFFILGTFIVFPEGALGLPSNPRGEVPQGCAVDIRTQPFQALLTNNGLSFDLLVPDQVEVLEPRVTLCNQQPLWHTKGYVVGESYSIAVTKIRKPGLPRALVPGWEKLEAELWREDWGEGLALVGGNKALVKQGPDDFETTLYMQTSDATWRIIYTGLVISNGRERREVLLRVAESLK